MLRTTLPWATLVVVAACSRPSPIPSPDPQGKDVVEGAVVAAETTSESTPGIRIYRVLHVDDYPEPFGPNLHLAAYDPKTATYDQAGEMHRERRLKIVNVHFEVRASDFLARDHRVLAIKPLTSEERAPYLKARDHR